MQIFVLLARAMPDLRNFSNGVVGFVLFTRSMSKLFRNKCLCLSKGDICVKKSIFNGSGYRFQVKELWGLCWPCSLQIDWWKVDRGNIGMFLSETIAGSHMSMWLSCCKICYKFGPVSILSTTSSLVVDFNNIFLELRFCSKFHWNSANTIFKLICIAVMSSTHTRQMPQ